MRRCTRRRPSVLFMLRCNARNQCVQRCQDGYARYFILSYSCCAISNCSKGMPRPARSSQRHCGSKTQTMPPNAREHHRRRKPKHCENNLVREKTCNLDRERNRQGKEHVGVQNVVQILLGVVRNERPTRLQPRRRQ